MRLPKMLIYFSDVGNGCGMLSEADFAPTKSHTSPSRSRLRPHAGPFSSETTGPAQIRMVFTLNLLVLLLNVRSLFFLKVPSK